jgi:hypothetical protein
MLGDGLKQFSVRKTFVYGYGAREYRQLLSKIPPKHSAVNFRQQILEYWIRGTLSLSCNRILLYEILTRILVVIFAHIFFVNLINSHKCRSEIIHVNFAMLSM